MDRDRISIKGLGLLMQQSREQSVVRKLRSGEMEIMSGTIFILMMSAGC